MGEIFTPKRKGRKEKSFRSLKKKSSFVFMMIFFLMSTLYVNCVVAEWNEPVTVIQGRWGEGELDFGFSAGQYRDGLPEDMAVMNDGKVVVADYVNKKWKLFDQKGNLMKSIPLQGSSLHGYDADNIISARWDTNINAFTIGMFNLQSQSWVWIDSMNQVDYGVAIDIRLLKNVFIVPTGKNSGIEYSYSGEVLSIITHRPLLFGKETIDKKTNDGNGNQVIEFEDATYNCTVPYSFDEFRRDSAGYLYGIAHNVGEPARTRVYKITKCGKTIGIVDFPPRKETFTEDDVRVDEDYGEPAFAQNGDVYTWKRTPEAYSILKWTWVNDPNVNEGPDAPKALQALPSISGIYLTWNPVPQGTECVTGYEIERASSAGGNYSSVTTVPKQQYNYNDTTAGAGATWYYRIRSTSDIGKSYPAEVSAARP